MADHTITITNSLNVFGLAPSNKWGDWDWNSFFWGEGNEDTRVAVVKLIENTQGLDDLYAKNPGKLVENDLETLADMGSEELTDGSGYTYNFPDRATDGEDRDPTTWSEGSNSTTWTEASSGSDDWSES